MTETWTREDAVAERVTLSERIVRFYYTLGALVVVGVFAAYLLGLQGIVGPGIFSDETAFAVAGLIIGILALALVVLLFTLGSTIQRIRVHLALSIQLREAIEGSYARLEESTENLRHEIQELRGMLPRLNRVPPVMRAANAPARTIQAAARQLSEELAELRATLPALREARRGGVE